MKRFLKKLICFALALAMVIPSFSGIDAEEAFAASRVRLSRRSVTIRVGRKAKLTLKGTRKGARVRWTAGNRRIVKVSQRGYIRGLKPGRTVVTAKYGRRSYRCKVRVIRKKKKKKGTDGDADETEEPSISPAVTSSPKTSGNPSRTTGTPQAAQSQAPAETPVQTPSPASQETEAPAYTVNPVQTESPESTPAETPKETGKADVTSTPEVTPEETEKTVVTPGPVETPKETEKTVVTSTPAETPKETGKADVTSTPEVTPEETEKTIVTSAPVPTPAETASPTPAPSAEPQLSGKISIDEAHFWEKLLEKITFGIYTADKKVSIENTGDPADIWYYVEKRTGSANGGNALTAAELDSMDSSQWLKYSGEFSVSDGTVIYAKLVSTENSDIYRYISSDGIRLRDKENTVKPETVTLGLGNISLKTGKTAKISASVLPENASDKTLKYESSSTETVSVENDGTITGRSEGKAVITVRAAANPLAFATVNVTVTKTPVEKIVLTPSELKIAEGASSLLTENVIPEDASVKDVIWSVSDEKDLSGNSAEGRIVSVDTAGNVTGKSAGTATVRVTSRDSKDVYAECRVTVKAKEIPAELVKISGAAGSLDMGEKAQLSASVTPADTTETVIWSSSDESRATVDQNGLVTGIAEGDATITARAGNAGDSVTIHVKKAEIYAGSITAGQSELSLYKDAEQTVNVTVLPENASDKTVTWTVSDQKDASGNSVNSGIVTVSADDENTSSAVIKASGAGSAKVTASVKSGENTVISASVNVKVLVPVTEIKLNEEAITMNIGDQSSGTFKLMASLNTDASDKSVTWKSSDEHIATVSESGLVTAAAPGKAVITASAANGKNASCQVTVKRPATGIKIPGTLSILEGEEKSISAVLTPADTTDSISDIKWSVSNEKATEGNGAPGNVILLDGGKVTGVSAGTAVVNAVINGSVTAQCSVTVSAAKNPLTAVSIKEKEITLDTGNIKTVEVTETAQDQTSYTTDTLKWSVLNEKDTDGNAAQGKIISVNGDTGVMTALAAGTATVKVESSENSGVSASALVTVKNPVTGINFGITDINLVLNKTAVISYDLKTFDGNETTDSLKWTSSDESIVSVDGTGRIKGLKKGDAKVTLRSESGISAVCTVHVAPAPVTEISIRDSGNRTVSSVSLEKGSEYKIQAVLNSDASYKAVKWSVSDSTKATVTADRDNSSKATVKASGTGLVRIMAAAEGDPDDTSDDKSAVLTINIKSSATGAVLKADAGTSLSGSGSAYSALVLPQQAGTVTVSLLPEDSTDTVSSVTSSDTGILEVTKTATGFTYKAGSRTGSADVTVNISNGLSVRIRFTVAAARIKVTSVTADKNQISAVLENGTYSENTGFSVNPADATDKEVTVKSSDENIAAAEIVKQADETGKGTLKITVKGAGSAKITLTSRDNEKAYAEINVSASLPAPVKTASPTPKVTATPAPTNAATPTPTSKVTATPAPTKAATPTPTPKVTATPAPTKAVTPTPTSKVTATPAPTKAATPTPTPKVTATPAPTKAATPTPTSKVTATPAPTKAATPTPTPEVTATPAPTKAATPTPTPEVTAAPAKVTSIKLSETEITLTLGTSNESDRKKEISADILPSTAENKTLKWTSEDYGIASVNRISSSRNYSKATVTAMKEGTVRIWAQPADDDTVRSYCTVHVKMTDEPQTGGSIEVKEPKYNISSQILSFNDSLNIASMSTAEKAEEDRNDYNYWSLENVEPERQYNICESDKISINQTDNLGKAYYCVIPVKDIPAVDEYGSDKCDVYKWASLDVYNASGWLDKYFTSGSGYEKEYTEPFSIPVEDTIYNDDVKYSKSGIDLGQMIYVKFVNSKGEDEKIYCLSLPIKVKTDSEAKDTYDTNLKMKESAAVAPYDEGSPVTEVPASSAEKTLTVGKMSVRIGTEISSASDLGFGTPVRSFTAPQGFTVYVFNPETAYTNLLYVYVKDGKVIGANTISAYARYGDVVYSGQDISSAGMQSGRYGTPGQYIKTDGDVTVEAYAAESSRSGKKGKIYGIRVYDSSALSQDAMNKLNNSLYTGGGFVKDGSYYVNKGINYEISELILAYDRFEGISRKYGNEDLGELRQLYSGSLGTEYAEIAAGSGGQLSSAQLVNMLAELQDTYDPSNDNSGTYVYGPKAVFSSDAADATGAVAYWISDDTDGGADAIFNHGNRICTGVASTGSTTTFLLVATGVRLNGGMLED